MFVCTRGVVHCREPIEVLSYKIGVCKVARYGDHDDHDNGDDDDGNGTPILRYEISTNLLRKSRPFQNFSMTGFLKPTLTCTLLLVSFFAENMKLWISHLLRFNYSGQGRERVLDRV